MALYECHVTIEPVFGDELKLAEQVAQRHVFKLAKLLMQKDSASEAVPSRRDTFMTGHAREFGGMRGRMVSLVRDLKNSGFQVRRYKIEEILVDSKQHDSLNLLS